MAGAQPEHVEITDNLTSAFRKRFEQRPCRSYSADLRVRVSPSDLWTYPDLSVVCGEPKFDRSLGPHSLLNPQVIFEVLSPSTEAFDRGNKFARYRQLESLTNCVLVSSEQMRVEHFVRQADRSSKFNEYHQPSDRLPLTSVECELPLAEIYERVTFPDSISR